MSHVLINLVFTKGWLSLALNSGYPREGNVLHFFELKTSLNMHLHCLEEVEYQSLVRSIFNIELSLKAAELATCV